MLHNSLAVEYPDKTPPAAAAAANGAEPAAVSGRAASKMLRLPVSLFSGRTAGGDFQGGATEVAVCAGRHLEDGLYLPEPDCASLHDSEGLFHLLGSPQHCLLEFCVHNLPGM